MVRILATSPSEVAQTDMDTESREEGNELSNLLNTETIVLENMYWAWSLFLTWTLSQMFSLQIQLQLLRRKNLLLRLLGRVIRNSN